MNLPSCDQDVFYSRLDGDSDLNELLNLFVNELPRRIEVMRVAIDAQNRDDLYRAVHQLKGAAGSYGFEELSGPLHQIEDAIQSGTAVDADLRSLVSELEQFCHRARISER